MAKFVDLERNEDQVFFINTIIKSRVIPDKYPFIQNIEFVRDIKDIDIYIYVDLIVDFQKYAEFTKKPIEPFWESLIKKGDKLSFGSMTSIFNIKYMDYFIDKYLCIKNKNFIVNKHLGMIKEYKKYFSECLDILTYFKIQNELKNIKGILLDEKQREIIEINNHKIKDPVVIKPSSQFNLNPNNLV